MLVKRSKLSKYFIYKWLKEDLYGEYAVYRSPRSNRLARKILDKIWFVIISYFRPRKAPFIHNKNFRKLLRSISIFRKRVFLSNCFNKIKFNFYKPVKKVFFKYIFNKKFNKPFLNCVVLKKNYKFSFVHQVSKLKYEFKSFYLKQWSKVSGWYYYLSNKYITKTKKKYKDKTILYLDFIDKPYVPKVRLVARSERPLLRRFHMLRYFNLVDQADFSGLGLSRFYYDAKKNMLSSASRIEFQLSTLLVRAGFVDNSYVSNHLAKRKLFSINGSPSVGGNQSLKVWDLVSSPRSTVWWFLFAKFIHFTDNFEKIERWVPWRFIRYEYVHRSSFFTVLRQKQFRISVYRRFHRSLVLSPVPTYMELSYKLFLFLIHKNAINKDLLPPYSISSLKAMTKGGRSWPIKFSILE